MFVPQFRLIHLILLLSIFSIVCAIGVRHYRVYEIQRLKELADSARAEWTMLRDEISRRRFITDVRSIRDEHVSNNPSSSETALMGIGLWNKPLADVPKDMNDLESLGLLNFNDY